MNNIILKVNNAYKQKRLFLSIRNHLKVYFQYIKYFFYNPAPNNFRIHAPDYVDPSKDNKELELVERIFNSFKKMKDDQKQAQSFYTPSSLWQQQLDESYSYFADSLESDNLEKFHYFLTNFGSWKKYHGIESNVLIQKNAKSFFKKRYLLNAIFYRKFKNWKWSLNQNKSISKLSYPMHGNQSGAFIGDNFVGVGSFSSEIYGSLLAGLVDDIKRPVVAELGAGYGKLGFFTLRDVNDSCYVDFDLPETLCLAAYFLMKTWPEKKTLLYGEDEYSEKSHKDYDLIFMPSFKIQNSGTNSIDLFMNMCSLGEMDSEAAKNYVHHITNSTKYFFHMNHSIFPNTYSDGSKGLLSFEYPLSNDFFKLLFKYPDFGHSLSDGKLDYYSDMFIYLYEKRKF
jgi:putative sugar O-methyltransferase